MPTPIQNIANAVSAYNKVARGGGLDSRDTTAGPEFADLVKGAIREAVEIGERSERVSLSAVNGLGNLNDVVTAVAEADVALKTVIAIRDKVIDSYQQIIRMPI